MNYTVNVILMLGLGAASLPVFADGTHIGRTVPYPSEFEIQTDSNGNVFAIPTKFTTRRTGVRTNVKSVGVVKIVNASPNVVRLTLDDGRSALTTTGKQLKLDGKTYQALGWRNGTYILKGMQDKKTLVFKAPKKG